eukprot:15446371-Alexandrium_andersonii.AAC.1
MAKQSAQEDDATSLPWTTTASGNREPFDPHPDAPLPAPPMRWHGPDPARPRHAGPLRDARDAEMREPTRARPLNTSGGTGEQRMPTA